jgi:predicted DNA-binding transcriptional regulator AlpA
MAIRHEVIRVIQVLPPEVLADVAQALYAVQDPESAARVGRAHVASIKRAEVETVLGALLQAGVVSIQKVTDGTSASEPSRLMSRQQVGDLFGLRKSAAYDLTQRPDFPPPVVVSSRCLRWPAEEVAAYAENLRRKEADRSGHLGGAGGGSRDTDWPSPERRVIGRVRPARGMRS